MRRKGLRSGLLLSTSVMTAVLGYSRRAYATCTPLPGPSNAYICTGAPGTPTAYSFYGSDITVVAASPTVFYNNAGYPPSDQISISGDGELTFESQGSVYLFSEYQFGVRIDHTVGSLSAPGNIDITTTFEPPTAFIEWGIEGYEGGIGAFHNGEGDIVMDLRSRVEGYQSGVTAEHTGEGDISISIGSATPGAPDGDIIATGLGSSYHGVIADHDGTGSVTITVNGDVTAAGGSGIYATTGLDGTGITVNLGDGNINGEQNGIFASNVGGTGGVSIIATSPTAPGTVQSDQDHAIEARNFGAAGITIALGAGDVTSNEASGISAYDGGAGGINITTRGGDVSGGTYGIEARNHYGGSITIVTGAGAITGTDNAGIFAYNEFGDGAVSITTGSGAVTGGTDGIYAFNEGDGGVTVSTGSGNVLGNDGDGIEVYHEGEGLISVFTSGGTVTGTDGHGIRTYSDNPNSTGTFIQTGAGAISGTGTGFDGINVDNYGGYVSVSTGTGAVTGDNDGIDITQDGDGLVLVQTTGEVTGNLGDGISVNNTSGVGVDISTGAGDVAGLGAGSSGIFVDSGAGYVFVETTTGSVTGDDFGINITNGGPDGVEVTTGAGLVQGDTFDGISIVDNGTGGVTVTTGAGEDVSGNIIAVQGGERGIDVQDNGGGAIAITTGGGAVIGETSDGVFANSTTGPGGIEITTGAGAITGGANAGNTTSSGIEAQDTGTGGITITVNDSDVTGDTEGVRASNSNGGSVEITTYAGDILGLYGIGIAAINNPGTGGVTITTGDGAVTGGLNDGIFVNNLGDLGVVVTTGDGTVTGGGAVGAQGSASGIEVTDSGTGGVEVNVNGVLGSLAVVGDNAGVTVTNNVGGDIDITTNDGNIQGLFGGGIYGTNGVGTGAITVETGAGSITGQVGRGIGMTNLGAGGIEITTGTGNITGGANAGLQGGETQGIYARDEGIGGITITVNGSDVTGDSEGIEAFSQGGGSIEITTNDGDILANFGTGILASNVGATGSITITTGDGSVTGELNDGIFAFNVGSDGVTVETGDGAITGGNAAGEQTASGIDVFDSGDGDVAITTGGGDVTGDQAGITAFNVGTGGGIDINTYGGDIRGDFGRGIEATSFGTTGAVTIITRFGLITGDEDDGIYARSGADGGINIATGDGAVNGGADTGDQGASGIEANDTGAGGINITTNFGAITGDDEGIRAFEAGGGGGVSIRTYIGDVLGRYGRGIEAYSYGGTGQIAIITNTGDVTGNTEDGIFARSSSDGGISITTRDGLITGGANAGDGAAFAAGIAAEDTGTGGITISTGDGEVTGEGAGISAINSGGGSIQISTFIGDILGNYGFGITALNNSGGLDDGSITIITGDGTVTGEERSGIDATNNDDGGISVTTGPGDIRGGDGTGTYAADDANGIGLLDRGAGGITLSVNGSDVIGDANGLRVRNYDGGNVTITTAVGTIRGVEYDGIFAYNEAGGGSIDISTGVGSVTGQLNGIYADNNGTGVLAISTGGGAVTGTTIDGIYASNQNGTGILIQTGDGVVSGLDDGIDARNYAGYIDITVNDGDILGTTGDGIYAYNGVAATDITVTLQGSADVTGGEYGIRARNYGTGGTTIDATAATGVITGEDFDGIRVINQSSTTGGVEVTTGAGDGTDAVYGYEDGIDVRNYGGGSVTVTTGTGAITGETEDGIFVQTQSANVDVTIVTGTGTVTGGNDGITALNQGTGDLVITTNGQVIGEGDDGIDARNDGVDLTITTNAIVDGEDNGVYADNDGTGELTITTNAAVNGETGNGVEARNGYVDYGLNLVIGTDITVTTNAVVTGGEDGIQTFNRGTGTTTITANDDVTGDDDGIEARSGVFYDGTVYGGNLTIYANVGVYGGDDGINAANTGLGNVIIITQDTVRGEDGNGIIASGGYFANSTAYGSGVYITTYGYVFGGGGDGIRADNNGGGDLRIATEADVRGDDGDGINAENGFVEGVAFGNNLIIVADGEVSGSDDGIQARNIGVGYLRIVTYEDVTGEGGDGINARNGYFDVAPVSVASGTDLTILSYGEVLGQDGDGIYASNNGTGALTITTFDRVEGSEFGINANNGSVYNSIQRGTALVITAYGDVIGSDGGIYALNEGNGLLDIYAQDDVTGTDGDGITAIAGVTANDTVYGLGIEIDTYGTVTGGNGDGIDARNTGRLNIDIYAAGPVVGEYGNGIIAVNGTYLDGTIYGQHILITTESTVTGSTTGIVAQNFGYGYTRIETNGVVTGQNSDGIRASNGVIYGVTPYGTHLRIYANDDVIGEGGTGIEARNDGTGELRIETLGLVDGQVDDGIYARNGSSAFDGGTNLVITTGGDVTGAQAGIDALNYAGGFVDITLGGDVTGADDSAVRVYNSTEGTSVDVQTLAGTVIDGDIDGIEISSFGSGAVTVDIDGDLVTGATGGYGIQTVQSNGTGTQITISAASTVQGGVAAISSTTDGTPITIQNDGTLQNLSGLDSALVVRTSGGATGLTNTNILTGRIDFGDLGDTLTNTGTWNTGGTSDFGGGADLLINSNLLVAANQVGVAESTLFSGLEIFENGGIIDLSDSATNGGSTVFDTLQITGNFEGVSGALQLDAFLGGAGSQADRLIIGGTASGLTSIVINNTSAAPGGVGANILLVDTAGSAGTEFVLSGGPISVGAYVYDLFWDGEDFFLQSALDTLRLDAATLPAVLGDLWEVTATSWHRNTLALQTAGGGAITGSTNGDSPALGGNTVLGWGTLILDTRNTEGTIISDVGGSETPIGVDYNQTTRAFIGGVDVSLAPDANGGTLTFGALLGVVDSTVDYDVTGNRAELTGPTYGLHVAYKTDMLRADLMLKRDDLDLEYTVFGLGEEPGRADAVSTGVSLEVGYKIHQTEQVTIEAVGNLSHVVTEIDSFTVGASTFDFGDGDTTRGAIGLTFRGNYTMGSMNMTPSATVKYWNVFDGGYSSAIDATAFSYDNTGGYLEASATLEFNDPDSGWSGFVTGSGFVGEDRSGLRAQLGVNLDW